MNKSIDDIVKKLNLKPLWEKDYIKEDYCSSELINVDRNGKIEQRALFNWAYYLIPEGCIFPFHKLLSDESWQFCSGGPLDLYVIDNGNIKNIKLGPNLFEGELHFHVIQKQTWFAATPSPGSGYTLVTHCVSPGWHPNDDIAGYYDEMIKLAPHQANFIKKFSWPDERKTYQNHPDYS